MIARRAAWLFLALGHGIAAGAPITGGASPSPDSAVVALAFTGDALECTGTVISPHAVLTAAHCVGGTSLPDVAIGDVVSTAERHRVLAAFVHPDFDPTTLDHDIAIVIVEAPLAPTPIPFATELGGLAAGASIRVVGYGWTVVNDTMPPRRRTGTSQVDAIDELRIVSHGAPSQVCEGDSGGPALYDDGSGERVVGVASSGDAACAQFGKHTRVDVHADFVADIVARTATGGADAGDRCWYPANCAVGTCLPAEDDPRLSFCAVACDHGACPGDLECRADACVHPPPSPGAEGAACDSRQACASDLCLAPGDGARHVCTTRCFSDLPGFDCPTGETCRPASDGGEACFGPSTDDGCGCRGGRGNGAALVLLAAGVLARGARRRKLC